MKRIHNLSFVCCLGLLFAASTCFAQMYTVTDLGTLGGGDIEPFNINASGQVVGCSGTSDNTSTHAFRTAPNSPINPATDDLGTLGGTYSCAYSINASGQVVGESYTSDDYSPHAFRTAPNSPINPATDNLGTLGGTYSWAYDINASGQVVGSAQTTGDFLIRAFRTAPNSPINPATDDLGTLGGTLSHAYGINDSGQVVGSSDFAGSQSHPFRTAPNSPINPATDDLGTLDGGFAQANSINVFGEVVGYSTYWNQFGTRHSCCTAFRTAPNSPINPATDDLGTLGGYAQANSINAFGEVVGFSRPSGPRPFLYSGGVMYDLNTLIPAGSGWVTVGGIRAGGPQSIRHQRCWPDCWFRLPQRPRTWLLAYSYLQSVRAAAHQC